MGPGGWVQSRGSTPLLHNYHTVPRVVGIQCLRRGEKPLFLLSRAHPPGRGWFSASIQRHTPDKYQQSGVDDNDCMSFASGYVSAHSRTEAISSRPERFINPRMTPSPRDQLSPRSKKLLCRTLGARATCPCLAAGCAMSPPTTDAHQSEVASAGRPGRGRPREEMTHAALHVGGLRLWHGCCAYRDARGKELG